MDKRHRRRLEIVQQLYAYSFSKNLAISTYKSDLEQIIGHKELIFNAIKQYAPKFSIEKIAKIDLSILQLSVYELIVKKKEPPKVIIYEAVELAKELGGEKSYAFINAVLGKVYSNLS